MSKLFTYSINTTKSDEFINITNLLKKSIKESSVKDGIALVFLSSYNGWYNYK